MAWSRANDDAMKLACAGSRESDVCTAKVKEARDYANNTGFAREIASHLDGRTDTNLLNVLGYDQWNSGDLARTSELENDPVLYGFNLVGCLALSFFSSGTCSSPPPPGSGQVEPVSMPGLEYGTGVARVGGKTLAESISRKVYKNTENLVPPSFDLDNVWNLNPTARGNKIEAELAKTEYKDWFNVGQLDNGKFPLVDFQKGDTLVSLKTVDTQGKGWVGRMRGHIDDSARSRAEINGKTAIVVLDIRVQPGGAGAAGSLIEYGRRMGVKVVVREF